MGILKLENVCYRYKDAPKDSYVFKDINYEFEQGKMYAIKGKSGSGKTTLLSLITGLENRKILKLSGGEQQRIAIARSLSYNPKIIIADEPTGNLDKDTENDILNIFEHLAKEENKCIIIVTHSQNVYNRADVVYELKKNS